MELRWQLPVSSLGTVFFFEKHHLKNNMESEKFQSWKMTFLLERG